MKLRRPQKDIDLEVRELVVERLRVQYPWMKTEAVHELAAQCSKTLTDGIEKQAPNIEASRAKISFLSLSPELRNRIYELVLIKGRLKGTTGAFKPIEMTEDGSEGVIWSEASGEQVWMEQPHLTAACRQVRNETLPIYYGQNTFELEVDARTSSRLVRALKDGSPADEISARAQDCTAFREASRWLRAMGEHNARLIRRFEIKMSADEKHRRTLFSSIVRHSGMIENGLRRLLENHFIISPPTISVMVQEAVFERPTFSELMREDWAKKQAWKELLQLHRPAVDPETPTAT